MSSNPRANFRGRGFSVGGRIASNRGRPQSAQRAAYSGSARNFRGTTAATPTNRGNFQNQSNSDQPLVFDSSRGAAYSRFSSGPHFGDGRVNQVGNSRGRAVVPNRGTAQNTSYPRRQIFGSRARGGATRHNFMERTTFGMSSQTLKELKTAVGSGDLSGIHLIQKLTVDGAFYKNMEVDRPTLADRSIILFLLASAGDVKFMDCQHLVHDLFQHAIETSLLEDSAKFFRDAVEDRLASSEMVTLHEDLQKDLICLMKVLMQLMEKFPTNSKKYGSAVAEVRSVLRDIEDKKDVICGMGHMQELLGLWDLLGRSAQTPLRNKPEPAKPDKPVEVKPPPENFRELDIFPSKRDILELHKPFLRKNIVDGAYEDAEHYLDVQFRLLREDYICPLRKGIEAFKNMKNTRNSDIRIYADIVLDPPTVDKKTGQVTSVVRFNEAHFRRVRWEVSKRLLYGSLVCFSNDEFQDNLIFATVANRQVELLKEGVLEVYFERPEAINYTSTYVMVESNAYFEAYRHVLEGLKALSPENMPFQKYLVKCDWDVELPRYIRHQDSEMDLSPLVKEEFADKMDYRQCDVCSPHLWPTNRVTGLDQSQFTAIYKALTNELAIVQGPPGTGKTYIGWQIAKVLLHNSKLWNPGGTHPMLVVCYTNHALDQFLEGILTFQQDGIIRVGRRSQSEELNRFLLNNVRREEDKKLPAALSFAINKAWREQMDVESQMNFLATCWSLLSSLSPFDPCQVSQLNYQILPYESFVYIACHPHQMSEEHYTSLLHSPDVPKRTPFEGSMLMAYWLIRDPSYECARRDVMKPWIVRYCMEYGRLPEINAKRLAYLSGNSSPEAAYYYFFRRIQTDPGFLQREVKQVLQWPRMLHIDRLVEMGFLEQRAVEAFMAVGVNNLNAAVRWLTPTGQLDAQEENPEPPEEEEIEEFQDLGIDAEDLGIDRDVEDDDFDFGFLGGMVDRSFTSAAPESMMADVKKEYFLNLSAAELWKSLHTSSDWIPVKGKQENKEYADAIKKEIFGAKPMSEAEVNNIEDVWKIRLPDRWRLFQYWMKKLALNLDLELRQTAMEYSQKTKQLRETKALGDVEILRGAKVLGMTTTAAARYQGALQAIQPRIVIMEEAAEVLEAHLVTSLSQGCQHVILIGDHAQLRPNPSVYQLAKHFNLEISLFERLIMNKFGFSRLRIQHRMRPEISRTLMPHFYDELEDAESVHHFEDVRGMQKNVFFINHKHPEISEADSRSHKNSHEAEWAVGICNYLLQQEYQPEDITILVAYSGQLFETRKILKEKLKFDVKVRVTIVDNYQGEEADIIILSLVRSNSDQKIGFLKIQNRVCVAMSRARKGFYVLGNFDHLRTSEKEKHNSSMWENIVRSLKQKEFFGEALHIQCEMHETPQVIQNPDEFFEKAPEGGCKEPCNKRMECGHVCPKHCHAYDLKHRNMQCMQPCGRMMKCGVHRCTKVCYEDCGKCMEKVTKTLPCQHKMDVECHRDARLIDCTFPCEKVLLCGHKCANYCSQPHTKSCEELIDKVLPCGHKVKGKCNTSAEKIWCTVKVVKIFPGCEHRNEVQCSTDVNIMSCPTPCGQTLRDCEHLCFGTCGQCRGGRLHVRCKQQCKNVLICGHECTFLCSKACPPCPKPCETACVHSQCGKTQGGKRNSVKGRLCGEPCPICVHPCEGICDDHRRCEKQCYRPCTLPRCMERCKKELNCTHNVALRKDIGSTTRKVANLMRQMKLAEDRKKKQQTENEELANMTDELMQLNLDLDTARQQLHRCIGVCGEPCMKICRFCNPEDYEKLANSEIFLGNEDEEDAVFIQLPDCLKKCTMEVRDVDSWVDATLGDTEGKREIVILTCPRCKTPIRKSRRYAQELKQQFLDVQQAKMKIIGDPNELIRKRMELGDKVRELSAVSSPQCYLFKRVLEQVEHAVNRPDDRDLSSQTLSRLENLLQFLAEIVKSGEQINMILYQKVSGISRNRLLKNNPVAKPRLKGLLMKWMKVKQEDDAPSFRLILRSEVDFLLHWIENNIRDTSQLMMEQFAGELLRLNLYTKLCKFFKEMIDGEKDLDEEDTELAAEIFRILNGKEEIGEVQEWSVKKLLTSLCERNRFTGLGITNVERLEILKAMELTKGHWFKCPRGHIYAIGDCGGAMERAECPECKNEGYTTPIGGMDHRLAQENSLASEMDGATAAAWPQ